MTTINLSRLFEVIEQEYLCCKKLLDVSRAEQRSLVRNDLKTIRESTQNMQEAIRDLRSIHARRDTIVLDIGKTLGLNTKELSFHTLIDHLGKPDADALRSRLGKLVRAAESLYQLNQQTIYLVDFSIDLIDHEVDLWADVLAETDGYDETGASDAKRRNANLIEGKV